MSSTLSLETESLRHEPGDDPRALRTLTLRFPDWRPWYGHATGRWWALSPTRYRQRIGLVEADTPAELAARIQHIEDFHPHPRTDPPDNRQGPRGRRRRPARRDHQQGR